MLLAILVTIAIIALLSISVTMFITLKEAPSHETWYDTFETRLDMGKHVLIISARPSIKWEEPEPYFDVGSMEVEAQSIFCSEIWS